MDKELIKIDDLVRQRFEGAEERERSGSWGAMRDLLDQELPQLPPPTGGTGGRAFRYAALLLLVSTAVIGSYSWLHTEPSTAFTAPAVPATPMAVAHATAAPATPTTSNTPAASTTSSPAPAAGPSLATVATDAPAVAPAHASSAHSRISHAATNLPALAGTPGNTPAALASTAHHAPATGAARPSTRAVAVPQAMPTPDRPQATAGVMPARTAAPGVTPGTKPASDVQQLALASGLRTVANPSALQPVQPQPALRVLQRDTIRELRIVHHLILDPATRTAHYRTDTEALKSVVVEKWVLADLTKPAPVALSTEGLSRRAARRLRRQWAKKLPALQPTASVAMVPQAAAQFGIPVADAAASKANTVVKLVPLAASRVDSRVDARSTGTAWNPQEQLLNFLQNTKIQLSQTKSYIGVLAGINSTLAGPGSLQGFQFGLTGLLAFNERLALAAELKYFQRFNGSTNLRDDVYSTQTVMDGNYVQNGQAYNIYRFDRDSSTRSFKFSTLSSLELPISLRYTFNRFSVLAGVNLAYHFRVNAEQTDVKYGKTNRYDTVLATMYNGVLPDGGSHAADVTYDDFRARFGLGYVAGATYQLSPAVHLDLRVAQQLWDTHRSTAGGRIVSDTYYQLPNLQLSVGYRFQQQAPRPRE